MTTELTGITPQWRQEIGNLPPEEMTAAPLDLDDSFDESFRVGYQRGYDVATARAESRQREGLPIERPR